MKTTVRIGLLLPFFILLTSQVFVSEARAQNILGEILRRMDSHSKGISSLQADLAMTKYDSLLEITDRPMIGSTNAGALSVLPAQVLRRRTQHLPRRS